MDVGNPSNFAAHCPACYGADREAMRRDVVGSRHDDNEVRNTIKRTVRNAWIPSIPHSAIAYLGLTRHIDPRDRVGQEGSEPIAPRHSASGEVPRDRRADSGPLIVTPAPLAEALAKPRHILRIEVARCRRGSARRLSTRVRAPGPFHYRSGCRRAAVAPRRPSDVPHPARPGGRRRLRSRPLQIRDSPPADPDARVSQESSSRRSRRRPSTLLSSARPASSPVPHEAPKARLLPPRTQGPTVTAEDARHAETLIGSVRARCGSPRPGRGGHGGEAEGIITTDTSATRLPWSRVRPALQ